MNPCCIEILTAIYKIGHHRWSILAFKRSKLCVLFKFRNILIVIRGYSLIKSNYVEENKGLLIRKIRWNHSILKIIFFTKTKKLGLTLHQLSNTKICVDIYLYYREFTIEVFEYWYMSTVSWNSIFYLAFISLTAQDHGTSADESTL